MWVSRERIAILEQRVKDLEAKVEAKTNIEYYPKECYMSLGRNPSTIAINAVVEMIMRHLHLKIEFKEKQEARVTLEEYKPYLFKGEKSNV